MKRSKTSKAWIMEHINDPYVQRAKAEGWRSRAAYKLLEIDQKDKLIKPGMTIVELGSAPGSWTQVVVKKNQPNGKLIALDLLEMEPVAGVDFIQGDFQDEDILTQLVTKLEGRQIDLVLSDMAPNMSGIASSDQGRMMYLAELALDFAQEHLGTDGHMLIKVFQGTGFMEFRSAMQKLFRSVQVRKPQSSRGRSAEVYLLGLERIEAR